ncbi:hypothetical protein [Ectobacillus funiculus]|uniref:Uncharacterized protein n=1 Tax=Ectobacillus funiculus TaxID=137993 RepID=A0ABV5WJ34_9BACI
MQEIYSFFPTVIVFAPEPLDPSFAYDPDIASRNQELRESILPAEREAIKTLMKSELTVSFSTA